MLGYADNIRAHIPTHLNIEGDVVDVVSKLSGSIFSRIWLSLEDVGDVLDIGGMFPTVSRHRRRHWRVSHAVDNINKIINISQYLIY